MGVRETARRLGLPEERVKKWAQRAKVCQAVRAAAQAVTELSPVVPSAADILAKLGPDSRSKLAVGLNKKATHLSAQEPEQIDPTDLLQLAKTGSVLHSWQEQAQGSAVMVNVNLLGRELPAVDIEANVEHLQSKPVSTAGPGA